MEIRRHEADPKKVAVMMPCGCYLESYFTGDRFRPVLESGGDWYLVECDHHRAQNIYQTPAWVDPSRLPMRG